VVELAAPAVLGLVLALVSARYGRAQAAGEVARPAEVKAAYLVNFLRYTVWPPSAFPDPATPLRVVVVGDDAVAAELLAIARRSPRIAGRPLEVGAVRAPSARQLEQGGAVVEDLRRAHAIYVADSDDELVARLLEALDESDVLTIGDGDRFAALGGMIGLREDGGRIVFDANAGVIRGSRLQVSARVLQLARVVGSEGR
jgi:hypothetical protein